MYVLESDHEALRLEKQNKISLYSIAEEIKEIDFYDDEKIADIGCGTCGLSSEIIYKNSNVSITAIDQSEIRLQQAKKIINPNHLKNIDFVHADIMRDKLKTDSFNTVVNRFVLHHVEQPKELLSSMYRILDDGGRLITIDSDGILFNYYSSNKWVMKKLDLIKKSFKIDMYIGRKLRSYYHDLGLKNVDVRMIPMHFTGQELISEVEQYQDRFKFMKKIFDKILGQQDNLRFKTEYLDDLRTGKAELFYNKFIVQGFKL